MKSDSERGNSAEKVETWAQDVQFFDGRRYFRGVYSEERITVFPCEEWRPSE